MILKIFWRRKYSFSTRGYTNANMLAMVEFQNYFIIAAIVLMLIVIVACTLAAAVAPKATENLACVASTQDEEVAQMTEAKETATVVEDPVAKEEPVVEEQEEDEDEEEPVAEFEEDEDELGVKEQAPNTNANEATNDIIYLIRYRKSFNAQLILQPDLQPIYKELKNEILSYKKVRSRLGFKAETFSFSRGGVIKMAVRGKRIYLYLALNPQTVDEKYGIEDVSDKKIGEKFPTLKKVRSNRSIKYAKALIKQLMDKLETTQYEEEKRPVVEYKEILKHRSFKKLLEEKLIVEYTVKSKVGGVNEQIPDEDEEVLEPVTEETIINLPLEAEIATHVTNVQKHRFGKMEIVNLGVISDNFHNDSVINLKTLREKNLISKNARRVKILADGILNKRLHVEADDFSLSAIKMIVYLGGTVSILS